jgi:CubicO group peptidase (beta-lactamase class C family)
MRNRTGSRTSLPSVSGLIASAILSSGAWCAQTADVVEGSLGAKLDDYLMRCAAFGFSGSVLVESDGSVILLKGYGLAEREQKRANTPDTIFDIGSLTKQFTATAILRLEQDGKLSTSDTLPKYFKGVPAEKANIQIYHLLTHTSGLPRAVQSVGSEMNDREAMVKAVLAAPLSSKPGQEHSYSNVGYDVLGAIVEYATGQSFEDYLRQNLFTPAQMADTGFRKDGKLPAARAARGYQSAWQPDLLGSTMHGESEARWDPSLATEGWYSWGLRGAGGVLTTTGDLLKWQHALDGETILKTPARGKLFKPYRDNYACGWYVLQTDHGDPWIEHGGTTGNGFDCKFTRFPEQKAVIIVLGNVLGGTLPWVNLNLGKMVRGEEVPQPPEVAKADAEAMPALEGAWEVPGGTHFSISAQDGCLVIEAMNDKALAALGAAPSPRAPALSKKTEPIVVGLAKDDFKALHAAEDHARPLNFFDDWWKGLEAKLGKRTRVELIGTIADPQQGDVTLVRVDHEKGSEILKLAWSGDTLSGTKIGPPYASRRVLQPTAAGGWVEFDLIASKVLVELRPQGDPKKAAKLELVVNGKNLVLTRSKAIR